MFTKSVSSITKSFGKMVADLDHLIEAKRQENQKLRERIAKTGEKIDANQEEIAAAAKVQSRIQDLIA